MALFMDSHTIEGGVAASDVAAAHAGRPGHTRDRTASSYLRYWVDEERGQDLLPRRGARRRGGQHGAPRGARPRRRRDLQRQRALLNAMTRRPALCHPDRMTVVAQGDGRRGRRPPPSSCGCSAAPASSARATRPTGCAAARAGRCSPTSSSPGGPPAAARLAELLFAEADDPLRALRWSLAEVRRALGDAIGRGRPGGARAAPTTPWSTSTWSPTAPGSRRVDVAGPRRGAARGPGRPGRPGVRVVAALASGAGSRPRREAVLHEAALGLLARGELDRARGFAVRAAAMSPLDENHQALLIRLYRLAGDDGAAARQYAACARLLDDELGVVARVRRSKRRGTSARAPPSRPPPPARSTRSSRPDPPRSQPARSTRASRRCAGPCPSPTRAG